ncbi:uncharacterized protein LOC130622367 [Hydractinia symbiolongicarpus]|uniref:uncharacterized protein LOC130622367 n=1 Tax=Hydractinia symbiolongicarpus TaxID=13093 RepID=UPI00254DA271|nr:uncharacterized protein LOC130622367 [Hydractinia symbiolongicarpus]
MKKDTTHNRQHARATEIDSSEDEDDVYFFQIGQKSPTFPVTINGCTVEVIIDSGSTINILDEASFNLITPRPVVHEYKVKIYPYKAEKPIFLKGVITASIGSNNQTNIAKFYIVPGNKGSLLGKDTAEALDILRVGPPQQVAAMEINPDTTPLSTKQIRHRHQSVFEGTGLLKDFKLKLHINPDVIPVQQLIRRVPFHTKEK